MIFIPAKDGLRFTVKLTPKGRANALCGTMPAPDGGDILKACVTAAPEDGKANEALIRILAETWNLPRTDFSIASGATSRLKGILITGNTDILMARTPQWPLISPKRK